MISMIHQQRWDTFVDDPWEILPVRGTGIINDVDDDVCPVGHYSHRQCEYNKPITEK